MFMGTIGTIIKRFCNERERNNSQVFDPSKTNKRSYVTGILTFLGSNFPNLKLKVPLSDTECLLNTKREI